MNKARIGTLDGFRAIAILSVIFFHFFSLDGITYPYGKKYDFFFQGRYGVEFFFIISGFVIFYTLENTETIKVFFRKRLIRLYPSALVATTATFFFLLATDQDTLKGLIIKYITSVSLVGPHILNLFSGKKDYFHYLDYSLWSLWPEIQFYAFASLFFYVNKKKFLRNFSLFSAILILAFWINSNVLANNIFHLNKHNYVLLELDVLINIFTLPAFIQYFVLGVLSYSLFKHRNENIKPSRELIITTVIFIIFQLYFAINLHARLTNAIMIMLFVALIYYPRILKIFDNKLLNKIGLSSYFLYLIHQVIGLVLIEKFGCYILPHTFIFPLILITCFISISILYTENIEKPIARLFKRNN